MAGKKGMKHYPESLKEQIRQEFRQGASLHGLQRKYGAVSYTHLTQQSLQVQYLPHCVPDVRPLVRLSESVHSAEFPFLFLL